jgi:hypothetical protein
MLKKDYGLIIKIDAGRVSGERHRKQMVESHQNAESAVKRNRTVNYLPLRLVSEIA